MEIGAVLDIETEAWDRFVLGRILFASGDHIESRNPVSLYRALFKANGPVYAHNGGLFDTLWALDCAVNAGHRAEITLAGARVIRALIKDGEGGKVDIRDSFALFPLALSKLAPIVGMKKGEPGFPCECGKNCGGYCAIRRDMPSTRYAILSEYLASDCEILMRVLEYMSEYSESIGVPLANTIGASAWKSAQTMFDLPDAEWETVGVYKLARAGYYGGRTEVFRTHSERGWRHDIHSAYPAALVALDLPVGPAYPLSAGDSVKAWDIERAGIYHADVFIPNGNLGLLPWREPSGQRLGYPTGMVSGAWTGDELRAAVNDGARIHRFGESVVWAERSPVMREWCRRLWRERDRVGTSSNLGKWLKLVMNSVTGKFAQSPEHEKAILCPKPDEIVSCSGGECKGPPVHNGKKCCNHRCTGYCGSWRRISQALWAVPGWRLSECAHVHWAAHLTAHTRITLRRHLAAGGGNDIVYCDTDSCYSENKREDVGDDLGQLGIEGEYKNFVAYAPKTYTYVDPSNNREAARAKGIPRADADMVRKFGELKPIEWETGVCSLKQAAAGDKGLFAAKRGKREAHPTAGWVGGRVLIGNGPLTRPPTVAELENRPR